LLLLDDFGLAELDTASRLSLLEILEDKHRIATKVITSQFPVPARIEIIRDLAIADAICDIMLKIS